MGNAMGNPLDEAKQARVNEIIQEVVGVFSKSFPIGYKNALISCIKAEVQQTDESSLLLMKPPVPSVELKIGNLLKVGDSVKSWKNRSFSAMNEEDNFRVDYFEPEGGKLKGSVHLCGYTPKHFDEEEAKDHSSDFGIKLVPADDKRRVWLFKCSSEEDRTDWMNVFRTGCFKAGPPTNKDKLISTAFKSAMQATRWNYGYYSSYKCIATEAETLGKFVMDILDREILNEVYDNIPAGPKKVENVATIHKTVYQAVMTSTNAVWSGVMSACESMKGALESNVKLVLNPIFEKEVGIKQKITQSISSKVNPFLADVGGRLCTPVFRCASSPVTKSFVASCQGFHREMKNKIEGREFSPGELTIGIKRASREVCFWWTGPLKETNAICEEMYNGSLGAVSSLFVESFTLYNLYNLVLDKNRALVMAGIYTFGERLKTAEGSVDQMALLNEVTAQLLHDAKIAEQEVLCAVISCLLVEPIATNVTQPCTELVSPIQDVIDALPGLGEFFNLQDMLESIIATLAVGSVGAIVDGGFCEMNNQINEVGRVIGVSAAD